MIERHRDPSINPSSSLESQGQGIECGLIGQGKDIHVIHTRTSNEKI